MSDRLSRASQMLTGILRAFRSFIGDRRHTETPDFSLVEWVGAAEIRRYPNRLAADTLVDTETVAQARQTGFKRLAGYIFGQNAAAEKIAMTAPVAQSSRRIAPTTPVSEQTGTSGGWRIRFFLPADMTHATAPRPLDDHVQLTEVPATDYAVLRFSGRHRAVVVNRQIDRLYTVLAGNGWQPVDAPVIWFYDPPWTLPWRRRNEVAVPVTVRQKR